MNAADVIGWLTKDGEYYCVNCCPTNEPRGDYSPIFGDSEADGFNHCADCEELIPESLTADGVEHALEAFEWFLTERRGAARILHQWAVHMNGWFGISEREDEKLRALVEKATEDGKDKIFLKNALMYAGLTSAIDATKPCPPWDGNPRGCDTAECNLARRMKEAIK